MGFHGTPERMEEVRVLAKDVIEKPSWSQSMGNQYLDVLIEGGCQQFHRVGWYYRYYENKKGWLVWYWEDRWGGEGYLAADHEIPEYIWDALAGLEPGQSIERTL